MNEQKINEFLSNADELLNRLKSVESPNGDKINLYVFGQPSQNVLKIISEAFAIAPQNSFDGLFVKGCKCEILYGETSKLYQVEAVEKKEINFQEMTSLMSQYDTSSKKLEFECVADSELLKKFNIHITISDNDYLETNWNAVLKSADYIFFALSSTALLSMCERKILRTSLLPNMGNDIGVLLTNNNMILSDDREAIDASLSKMFGNYETSIFRFPEEDEAKFVNYVNSMISYTDELHERRKMRNKQINLNELLHEVDIQLDVLSSDNVQLDDVVELLNEKLQKLPDRKESAFRRARMKYTSKLKIELAEAVSVFHQQFEETLEKEIESNDNIEELQNILPDYISSQWENEAIVLNNRVNDFTESVSVGLKDYINDDITSYIEDGVSENFAEYVFGLTKMYLQNKPNSIEPAMQAQGFDAELKKDNTKLKKYGVVASGVALVMMSHPIVGIAVAVFGSKMVAKKSEKAFIASGKQALLEASKKMCIDFHNEMDLWIEQVAKNIENHLESCIGECYQNVIDMMIDAVKSKQKDLANYDEEIKSLKELKEKIQEELN